MVKYYFSKVFRSDRRDDLPAGAAGNGHASYATDD